MKEKCCGNTSSRRVFPQVFRVLPNYHKCFYNSAKTWGTCFLFLLENTATKKNENNFFKVSFLAPSLRQQCVLVLCFYRVIETRFLTSIFSQDCFLIAVIDEFVLFLDIKRVESIWCHRTVYINGQKRTQCF